MNTFDSKARDWDKNKTHMDRSEAIALEIENKIPLSVSMKAMEYGAGTGNLSFLLKDKLGEICLMDSSQEMIKVCHEKVENLGVKHIKPLWYNLETDDYQDSFDLIFNQMVLHHVKDVETIIRKFFTLLNPGGYLAIADLYQEDGSFHGLEVDVHHGFNPENLEITLKRLGFNSVQFEKCFEIKRDSGKIYPIFLLVAKK